MAKEAAKESEIGVLHNLITKVHNMKAEALLDVLEDMVKQGAGPEEIAYMINSRDLATMQKWVEYNGVTCVGADEDDNSDFKKKLDKLKKAQKGKIVPFKDPLEEAI